MARKPKKQPKKSAKQAQDEAPRKRGRPSRYSEEIAIEICDRLAKGESLNSICKSEHLPSESTVRDWSKDKKHPFSASYAKARETGYLRIADELLDIADDGTNDWMERKNDEGEIVGWVVNGEAIARSRLRVDTRKWVLAKMLPKVFGDKVVNELTGPDGSPIQFEDAGEINKIEIARKLLFLVKEAADSKGDASNG